MERLLDLCLLLAIVLITGIGPARNTSADDRRFTYTYEATTMMPGLIEYEQWVTWKTDKGSDSSFDRIDFRHEIEFGITDTLQIAFYLSDWRYQDGKSVEDDGAEWRDIAVEVIYQILNPNTEPIGAALYGEIKVGDELFELEGKVILQKNIGKWVIAYNGIIETEWENSNYSEDKGAFANTFGASYQINPGFTTGVEVVHEIEYDDWSEWEDHVLYAGPNLSLRTGAWWMTVTPLIQVTDVDSEANFQVRFIFGFDF